MATVDSQIFKDILARWSSGITIITVNSNNNWQGFTANSFASVSMEPPLICMNVASRLLAREYIAREGHFAISILSDEQLELGKRFAGFFDEQFPDRFEGISCETSQAKDPYFTNSLAWLACEVEHMLTLNENTMFIGRVTEGQWQEEGLPLMYHNRQWGTFNSTEKK